MRKPVECSTPDQGVAGSRHCVVPLNKTLYPLLSTCSTPSDMSEKLLTGM